MNTRKWILLTAFLLCSCASNPRAEIQAEAEKHAAEIEAKYPVTEPSNSTSWRNFQSEDGMKLAQAIGAKDKATVSRILATNPALANSRYRAQGCFHSEEGPILFTALNDPEITALLLENGADIEGRNRSDLTPLMSATSDANPETVKLLVTKNANPDAIVTNIWNNASQTRTIQDVPEQKLTALDIARLNLQSYEKSDSLSDRENKIAAYKKIIGILKPITTKNN